MLNHTGRNPIESDKAEASQNLFDWEKFCERRFVAQSVLQSDDGGVFADQRRQKFRKLIVRGRLQRDQHEVACADFRGRPCGVRPGVEITVWAADAYTLAAHNLVIRAQQEVNILSVATEHRAVIAANGAGTDDSYFHDSGWVLR